jgi:hypothetical protein
LLTFFIRNKYENNYNTVRNKLGVLESRDRGDKNIVLLYSHVCLHMITRVLFIRHKQVSDSTKVMIHSLMEVIRNRRNRLDIH